MHNRNKTKDGEARPFLLFDGRRTELYELLSPFGRPVALPPFDALPEPVRGHPDLLTLFDRGQLYTYEEYARANEELFASLRVPVRRLALSAGAYPNDLWLDCLPFSDRLICRRGCAPDAIAADLCRVYVRQGYVRCSTLCAGDRAVITADEGIARACERCGAKVLRIGAFGVELPGYDCGFIGGASAVVGKNVLFFGELGRHPDGARIKEFIESNGSDVVSFPDMGNLKDCGGLTVIEEIE